MQPKQEKLVKGPFFEGSATIYRKNGLFIEKGLQLDNSTNAWFPGAHIGSFYDGMAAIDKDNGFGFINKKGEIVIEPKYLAYSEFSEGLSFVFNPPKTFLINKNEEVIAEFDEAIFADEFRDGIVKVGLLDESIECFTEGMMNNKGGYIVDCRYKRKIMSPKDLIDDNDLYSCGLMRMCDNGKFGFLDGEGNIKIPFKYDKVSRFINDQAAFVLDGKAGFINTAGDIVLPPIYEDAAYMRNGIYFVKKDGYWGGIRFNEVAVGFVYDKIVEYNYGVVFMKLNGYWGFMDIWGKLEFYGKFDSQPIYDDGLILFYENGRRGVLNAYGDKLVADIISDEVLSHLN
ncbi:MAG: WG repeat-containing protein [Melioribacteraceae bacterium]|nr:WG repeat-containing protein [Melioribacteraceae bacterium]